MITSATWTEDKANIKVVMDDGTILWVPDDMANVQRQGLAKWEEEGGVIQPYMPPSPTVVDVDRERDRRNNQGQQLTLNDGHVVSVATATREDFDNINFSADTALTLIAKTEPTAPVWLKEVADKVYPDLKTPATATMVFRDFYRLPVEVTYHEMAEIQVRITANIVLVNQAAHLLKDMPEILVDYADDKYWPVLPVPPSAPEMRSRTK